MSAMQSLPWFGFVSNDPSLDLNLDGRYDFTLGNTADRSGSGNDATSQGGTSTATDRKSVANAAYSFSGTGYMSTTNAIVNPTHYSANVWFKTTSTTGGVLVGFADTQTGTPANWDRLLWMDTSGYLHFGVYTGSILTITNSVAYNDGNWHMVTTAMSTVNGMKLFVDGAIVASNANTTSQSYTGYWRIGGDNLSGGWDATASNYFTGVIDDVRLYNIALNITQERELYKM